MVDLTQFEGHTPGPWKPCRANEDYNGFYWKPADEEEWRNMEEQPYVNIESPHARVTSAHDYFQFRPADARLIAAAPDLLAECIRLRAELAALKGAKP